MPDPATGTRPRAGAARLLGVVGLTLSACDALDGTSILSDPVPTAITFDSAALGGAVACAPGALQSYVVTLLDVTDPAAPTAVASSPPVSCAADYEFRSGIEGTRLYRVDVDGYEAAPGDLSPVVAGGREVADASGDVVLPRYTTACGERFPTQAVTDASLAVGDCAPLADAGTPSSAVVVIDPAATLGALACTDEGGIVSGFSLSGGPLGSALVACGAEPLVLDPAPLAPFSVVVTASTVLASGPNAGQPAGSWGASCEAVPRAGRKVHAACTALSDRGQLSLDPLALGASLGLSCGEGFVAARASLGSLTSSGAAPCGSQLSFTGLAPGEYVAQVVLVDAQGADVASFSCPASVLPGVTTSPVCSAL
jgi:hypothetical protein